MNINKIDKNYRIKKLKSALQNEREIDEVDTVLGKEELYKDLLERIHKIILGEFEYNKSNKDFIYRKQGYAFDKKNVATGIKSFGIIEILLKNKQLDENTILIIDEPEVHLHPQWIVEYARILVLIHKYIGCHIFISSHNPDMIQAIRYISEKQDVLKSLDFYLADEDDNKKYTYRHLSKDIEPIFECFNVSLNKIEKYSI